MIVNARMYAVAPAATRAWQSLFARVGELAGVEWTWADHPTPAPISALWARADAGCVFMCGLPYISGARRHQLLAAPVPSLPRYEGRPVYHTEFIVRADAPHGDLPSSFGTRLACMLPESNSGHNAPRHHLMTLAGAGQRALYRPAEVPTPTPQAVIDAVLDGQAEVGVVDGYVLDLLRRHHPARVARLRTLAVTAASPIPPLVAAPGIDADVVARLRGVLANLHRDARAAELLPPLCLSRFARVAESDYAVLAAWRQAADRRGFMLTSASACFPPPPHPTQETVP